MSEDWERGDGLPSATPSGVRLAGLLALVVAAAMAVSLVTGGWNSPPLPTVSPSPSPTVPQTLTREPSRPIGAASIQRCPVVLGGLAIGGPGAPRGAPVSRWFCSVQRGPYAVVVRRSDGTFGQHGAVVTWPVDVTEAPQGEHTVTWVLAGRAARVHGDLPHADLVAISAGTKVASGRPVVTAPTGFSVISTGLSDTPLVHELRYSSSELGLADALGAGVVFTGLRTGAAFEEGVYSNRVTSAGKVAGQAAVVWGAEGANGYVAWEPARGQVAYVGYTGAPWSPAAAAALKALASRTAVLTPAQFDQASR